MLGPKIFILFWVCKAATSEFCKTPNGQYGDCKSILQCPPLISLLGSGRRLSNATATLLRQSQCGSEGAIPKVCCPAPSFLLPEWCGSTAENRIFGGKIAGLNEFPWTALLEYQRKEKLSQKCGGSLISKRYVLTARHCLRENLVRVRLGEHDIRTDPDCLYTRFGTFCNDKVLIVDIEEKISHPDADIALLRLKKDVQFTDSIKPICLPFSVDDKKYLKKKLVVSGWGSPDIKKVRSDVKLKVEVPVKSFSVCPNTLTRFIKYEEDYVICAGGEEGKDSCTGDSGGPLMGENFDKDKNSQWYIFGVVSSGPLLCGQKDQPGHYVRVSKYVDWIVKNLKP